MTSKQARRIKAEQAATAEAGRIIEEARTRIGAKPAVGSESTTAPKAARKARPLDPALAAQADAVKAARDQGVAWWRIAHDLGLPGSAETVARGKAGAALARRIYASAFGELPKRPLSERTLRKKAEKDPNVQALRQQRAEERVERTRAGVSVIPADMPDEELIKMVKGRTLTWTINLADIDGGEDSYSDDSAMVHPRWVRVDKDKNGERVIVFKLMDGSAKTADARANPGGTRTVRTSRIHTVR